MTDDGPVQSGTAHPARDSISHPYTPIPNTSNVTNNTNEVLTTKYLVLKWQTALCSQGLNPRKRAFQTAKAPAGSLKYNRKLLEGL